MKVESARSGLRSLGRGLGITDALLQTLGAALTAAVKFFFPFDFLVSHVFLQICLDARVVLG